MFFISTARMSEGEPASAPVVSEVSSESPVVESKPEAPKVRSLKVNGRVVEVPEDQVEKYLSLGLASHEKFAEAKKIQEEAQKILALKGEKSAMKTLLAQGYTKAEAKAILEDDLRREYEDEELSPEEKERKVEKAKLAQYEAEEKARKERIEEEARTKEEQAYLNKLDDEIAEAVEKSGIPKHPILGKMAINYMHSFAEQGQELSASEAMKYVAADWDQIIKTWLSGQDAKGVKKYLKDDHVKGLRDEALVEYQTKQKPFDKPATASKQAGAEPDANDVASTVIKGRDFWAKKRGF